MKNIAILILTTLAGCTLDRPGNETDAPVSQIADNHVVLSDQQLQMIALEPASIEKSQLSGTIMLNGRVDIDPDHRASLSSALGGRINSVNALPGQHVRKGEVMVVLEDNQFIQIQLDYLSVKAQLLSVEPNYIRQKELNDSKAASDKVMQVAETEYRSLMANKSALEEKLRLINIEPSSLTPEKIKRSISIESPFNGMVSRVLVNKGKYVSASDVLVEVINPEGILLNIKVFEKDWPRISVGQLLEVHTNQNPESKINARVITKGNVINDDGSSEIMARVTDKRKIELVAGLYINASVNLDSVDAYTLPDESVVSFEGDHYVFEYKGTNAFQMTQVETGISREGRTAIRNHLELDKKKIVGKGAYALLMALKNKAED